MPEPTILHRCPSCGRWFDSPSVCWEDGTETVPTPQLVTSQWAAEHIPAAPEGADDA